MRLWPISFIFLLAACVQTTDELLQQRVISFKGMTMAAFMRNTGMVPHNYYDTSSGRTYLVSDLGCNLQLGTRQLDTRQLADSWQIETVVARGPCGRL
jgi:hypothetical protein